MCENKNFAGHRHGKSNAGIVNTDTKRRPCNRVYGPVSVIASVDVCVKIVEIPMGYFLNGNYISVCLYG